MGLVTGIQYAGCPTEIIKCDKPSLAVTEAEIGGMRKEYPLYLFQLEFIYADLNPKVILEFRCATKITYTP